MSLQQKLNQKGKMIKISDDISITILDEKYNKLLKRAELSIYIDHIKVGTPSRKDLRKFVAFIYKVDEGNIIVKNIESEYGKGSSKALVYIYEDLKYAKLLEPQYIFKRHGIQ